MSTARTPAVLVMAKTPRPGTVKTRLHPLLGPQRCAVLQAELIRHTLETTTAQGLRTYLAYAPDGGEDEDGVRDLAPAAVRLLVQRGGDLGQRLTAAVAEVFADGAGPLLVIGTDAPTLTAHHLAAAFTTLESRDVVLGPALDGGYYLIGMHSPHPQLFALDTACWSTDKVLATTFALATDTGLHAELISPLRDLDTPEDAAALRDAPLLPQRIAALLDPLETA
ncbi:TIGR04282 family arsenosugar biosynthesis glycosyltransferase [Streptomyces halobius]|uniref:TIGR04282 family arsenosugar biosynthesis glycosyltransferase n=1 Tax=Streptomyces halobius TaxID=2879846 RepID=A0ABY4M2P2_9ACTN|nr:TIGR04282 family arsenosugar biosynthesis glycosyltransferase [Streptomyces halobius]UQA91958.1 TIGR04282 family arsenosugar biosynthesis glycosyltransferase [Streptomyces halobius]